jgi:hypothetical protein
LSYDELKYWNSRVNPNTEHGGDFSQMINFLWERIPNQAWVLDFGPGVGRLFPGYRGAAEVVGVDISKLYATRLFEAAKQYNFNFSLVLSENVRVPAHLAGFDVAVASMVLLHQKPETIGDIMLDLAHAAREVLVLTWMSERQYIDIAPHCFNHNYGQLCKDYDLNILDWDLNHETLRFSYAL